MKKSKLLVLFLAATLLLVQPAALWACPSCQEAPAAEGAEDDSSPGNGQAYNYSIYVMVGVPYFCLTVLGVLLYRGLRKNEQYRLAHGMSGDVAHQPQG